MNAQHTPGPWKFGGWGSCGIFAHDGKQVARVRSTCQMYDGESTANAQLLASAPDLLAALEASEAELTRMHGRAVGPGAPLGNGSTSMAIRQARAAIAQAEGGAK